MANFQSLQILQNVPGPSHGIGGDVQRFRFQVALTAAAALNDTIEFGYVPAGFRLLGAVLKSDDLDTGVAAMTLDVGDAADPDRIFAASTVGQTGTYTAAPANTAMDYKWTAQTLITGLVKAAAATPAAGNLYLILLGVIEGVIAS